MLELNRLYNMDCFDGMKMINDKSIDLIVTDPPYNIGKAKWDKIPNYIEWCGEWIKECERALKNNGSFYFFHNDMPQVAQLMEWIRKNTRLVFNSLCLWDKGDFRALAWKNPSEASNLRSWFNTFEYCLFYTFQDETGLSTVMLDTNNFPTMRGYFKGLLEHVGENKKQVIERIGQRADHCFRWNSTQWDMPTPSTYQELIDVYGIDKWHGFREYESLRQEYESLRYVHNLDPCHNNKWTSKERNTGQAHPTQKPIDILERIIRTSSNEGGNVLDLFMGSGTTAIACMNTGRNFVGFEIDEGYFQSAQERIRKHCAQERMELPTLAQAVRLSLG